MANQNLNPLSRLLDIDFPDFKRANWNNSFDHTTTSDIGFVKPVFVDHIMAGTRAQLDFNTASFANSTIAPLYGRYKVKYLAFWAPDRLYMPDWLTGEKMTDDNYPYPFVSMPIGRDPLFNDPNARASSTDKSNAGGYHVPVASLSDYLKLYPAYTNNNVFSADDNYPNKNAFAFLAFWDAYRSFILNPQETTFPVRTKAFQPSYVFSGLDDLEPMVYPALPPENTPIQVSQLDDFFRTVKHNSALDVSNTWRTTFGFDPLFAPKRAYVVRNSINYEDPADYFFVHELNYGLPIAPYNPDMFTSFISNENVELERTKSTVVSSLPDAQGRTSFTMEQWFLASRIQSKIRRNIYKFQDFAQWIDTNFGIRPSTTLTQPMFLGAFSSDIIFNDVLSTVQQGDNNTLESNRDLGSRAGFGVGKDGNRSNFFDFTAQEPGTVMILQWIIPEVFYFEHSHKFYETLNFNEEFNPIFDALGFQDLERSDMNMVPNLAIDPTGVLTNLRRQSTIPSPFSAYNTAVAQQPYAMEHMGKLNILSGQMVQPEYYQSWSLARSFNYIRSTLQTGDVLLSSQPMGAYSTYIIPEMYNNIFANNLRCHNFQFYLSFDYKKYQPVSKQFLSFTN